MECFCCAYGALLLWGSFCGAYGALLLWGSFCGAYGVLFNILSGSVVLFFIGDGYMKL